MDQEVKISVDDQKNASELNKNKGGRPKGQRDCSTKEVTLYLTEDEYGLLTKFAKTAWGMLNYSGAARHLVLKGLKGWVKKGKKEII